MINAGQLRHPITIEQMASEPRDAVGGITPTWSTFASPWAALKSGSAREFVAAQARHGEVTHLFIIRHIDGITPKMRINFDGRLFDIQGAINVNQLDRATHISAKERV